MAKTKKKTASKVSKSNVVAPELKTTIKAPVDAPGPVDAPAPDGVQLTIADLQSLASVIDVAVRRGAFGAGEVTEVGAIFDKLSNFLKIIAAQKTATDAAEGSAKGGSE